jgi:hypothetical protein
MVLPQRGHAVGNGLTTAHADDDRRLLLQYQLVEHKRRELIEQVCVIDCDDDATAVGCVGQGVDDATHQLQRAASGLRGPLDERSKRNRARARIGEDPPHLRSSLSRRRCGLGEEPALADAGRSEHRDARETASFAEGFVDEAHFFVAAGQRPRTPEPSLSHVPDDRRDASAVTGHARRTKTA